MMKLSGAALFEKVKDYLFYGDVDKESYELVKPRIEEGNRLMALVFACVATFFIGMMFVLSFSIETFVGSRKVYIFGIILSIVQILISLLGKNIPALSYVSVYMAVSVFLLYGIALATITRPEEQTVTFMVMMILIPLLFVDRPIRMACVLLAYIILFVALCFRVKTGAVLPADVTDAFIFGFLSIVTETIVNRTKIQRFVLEMRLQIMSQKDQLTGLNNRNCYEYRLRDYSEHYKDSLGCIYVDINGLHELNNSKGHKAGDEMLCYIADCLKDFFGDEDTYRIGGDEYVAFAANMSPGVIEEKLSGLLQLIEKGGYHAAIGYEFTNASTVDINALITGAETRMYKSKAEFYRTHDRRERRG